MFEDYDDVFNEPSEADAIISQAQADITELLKKSVVEIVDNARDAKKNLESLNERIRDAELKLRRIKGEIEHEEALAEQCKMNDVPQRLINRVTSNVTKGFAPGDKVFMLTQRTKVLDCPLCMGKKKVLASINGREMDAVCPECKGLGKKYENEDIVTEQTIERIDLRLCFGCNRISYWETECVRLYGYDFNVNVKSLFKTKDEALKELDRRKQAKDSKEEAKA